MAGSLKIDTLINGTDDAVPVDDLVFGSCRAWVNFNGSGVVAINSAYNVSSVTDNGVGDYTINFSAPIGNTLYGVTTSSAGAIHTYNSVLLSGSVSVLARSSGGTLTDTGSFTAAIFANV